jgi:hypothetical protein
MEYGRANAVLRYAAIILTALTVFSHCIKKTSTKEIFKDDFNRSGGLGAKWTLNLPSGTNFITSNNRAYPTAGGLEFIELPAATYKEKVTENFKVSAKFTITTTKFTNKGFIFARSAASDSPLDSYVCGYYYVAPTTTPVAAEKYLFLLGKAVSGTLYGYGEIAMHTLNPGISDTVTFTLDGSTLKCEMAGNSTISVSVKDASLGNGYTGITGGGASTNYLAFDDFLVEKL